ncbi:hypothetical protein F5H01DRAFT_108718 [Linnemannia elongata]|nr:hypothetical protein F5H01DRAFT_108718 [Linnemannia elongata]
MGSFHSSPHLSHLVFFEGKLALAFPSLLPCLLGLSSIIIFFLFVDLGPSVPPHPSVPQSIGRSLFFPFSLSISPLCRPSTASLTICLFVLNSINCLFVWSLLSVCVCVCVCVCTSHIFPSPSPPTSLPFLLSFPFLPPSFFLRLAF